MQFNPAVYDLWVFRRRAHGVEFLVLRTSQLARVHYRGLKDGLRSTHDYIAGVDNPAPELRLR